MRTALDSLPELVIDVDATDCMPPPAGEVATMPSPQSNDVGGYDQWQQLWNAYCSLGPNARDVLLDLASRLVEGKAYGDFEKKKNWPEETNQELLDALVYLTVENRQRVKR